MVLQNMLDLFDVNFIGLKKVLNIRTLIIFILLIAGIFIIIDITKMYYKCPKNKIEYRYIPRSFNDEQENIVPIKSIYGKMFDNPSPWVNSFTDSSNLRINRDESNVRQN